MLRIVAGIAIGIVITVAALAIADHSDTYDCLPADIDDLQTRVGKVERLVPTLQSAIDDAEEEIAALEELVDELQEHDHAQPFETIELSGEGRDGYHIHHAAALPPGRYKVTYTTTDSGQAVISAHDGFDFATHIAPQSNTPTLFTALEGHHMTFRYRTEGKALAAADEFYIQVPSRDPWTLTIEAVTDPSE